jgi:hypothetical protein
MGIQITRREGKMHNINDVHPGGVFGSVFDILWAPWGVLWIFFQ